MGKGWPISTLGDLCRIEKGQTGIASATPGKYPLVNTSAERKTCNSYQFDTAAVCIPLVSSTGHGKKSLNYVHFQQGKFALGTILAAVIPKDPKYLSAAYMQRYLHFYKDKKIVPLMKGAANVSLAVKDIAKIEIPVPPIDVQESFVELFGKQHSASLKLQGEFNSQSTYLTQLRQAILQEAIEGKLTAAWRTKQPATKTRDENNDAAVLLERIKKEKIVLVKKEKELPPIEPDEVPFALPEGWVWTRLGEIIQISSGDGLTAKEMAKNGEIPVFGGNGINGYHNKANISKATIVIGRVGALCGAVHLTPDKAWVTDNAFITTYNENLLNREWLSKLLTSLDLRTKARETAQPVISGKRVYPVIAPLPPLAEQQSIVERVDKLLAMVDQLEKQVAERREQAEQLMQAVLREAFG